MLSVANNHNFMCHVCAKGLLASNFNEVIIYKISKKIFMKLPQISHIHKNRNFLRVIGKRKTNCCYPVWQRHLRNLHFNFCQL